ncbi:ABC transporter ATP-binding protein [Thauera butanivorans]|uniref:ABC transporter ATP-binding protein n=1 Tax=Thauera butanivorans TaxID=86174 RepID=UPI003AB550EF
MSGVALHGLRKYFTADTVTTAPRRGAIDGLDLDIRDGEFFVLLGPSGCGKTTTLRCIAGLEEPSAGRIEIGGAVVADTAARVFVPPDKREIGMVFQSYALWPHMTVFDNVAYPVRHRRRGLSRLEIAREAGEALSLVGLAGLEGRAPAELSGGQQQRVALARAIAARPRLLLFDEPLSNLDAQLRLRLRQDLRRVHEEAGRTSVYVTHDQAEALALADRVAVMRLGRLEQLGTPTEIFLAPATRFVAEFVGFDNLLPGTVISREAGQAAFRPDGWSGEIAGRAPAALRPGQRGVAAIRSANLRLARGEAPHGQVNSFAAAAGPVTYLGERFQAEVEVAGHRLFASLPLEGWNERGDLHHLPHWPHAHVGVAPGDVVILPDAAGEDALAEAA